MRFDPSPLALPPGMRDLLPARVRQRRAIARTVSTAFQRYGYEPVVPPAFERESVVARGLGGAARRELVRFLDPDHGEVLVLRPDMTPQVARIVATHYRDVTTPVRLSYEGSTVRRPAGRASRQRQVSQAGVECVGWASPEADVEVIVATARALEDCGLRDFKVELSHAGALQPLLERAPEALRERVADAVATRDEATWRALLAGDAALCDALARTAALAGEPRSLGAWREALDGAVSSTLQSLLDALEAEGLGDRVLLDLGELRGRGYYTGVFFEFLCEGNGAPVAAGGRYDALLGRYGVDRPATGAAIDLEGLEAALSLRGALPTDTEAERVLVVGRGARRREVARALRADGRAVTELDGDPDDDVAAAVARGGHARVVRAK